MNAIDLITYDIPPLVHSDSGEKAMNWMDEFKVSHFFSNRFIGEDANPNVTTSFD